MRLRRARGARGAWSHATFRLAAIGLACRLATSGGRFRGSAFAGLAQSLQGPLEPSEVKRKLLLLVSAVLLLPSLPWLEVGLFFARQEGAERRRSYPV